jgi:hypothetical protein
MERTIDDLPMVKVSTLVAAGDIKPGDTAARIRFVDDGVEYVVGVKPWRFKSGGFGAFLVCLRCGGGAQRLRLLDDIPACGKCVRESGLIYRSQATRTEKRHLVTAPVRIGSMTRGTGGCDLGGLGGGLRDDACVRVAQGGGIDRDPTRRQRAHCPSWAHQREGCLALVSRLTG